MMDEDELMFDDSVFEYYETKGLWGMVVHVDLFGCSDAIASKRGLEDWVIGLCDRIDMTPMGPPVIAYLSPTHELAGYSLMQLIQTSSITGHFCDATQSAYIDIFSCKPFGPHAAKNYCERFFDADMSEMQITFREKEPERCKESRLTLEKYAYIV